MLHPELTPQFISEGKIFIIPKNFETKNLQNYHCIITNKTYRHLNDHSLLAKEQKGCKRGSQGSKAQLIADDIVTKNHQNLHLTYIDYRKIFDIVPHGRRKPMFQIYKKHPTICNFFSTMMSSWKTKINLRTKQTYLETSVIEIRRGVYQGDALIAIWFCMNLKPLSNTLNEIRHELFNV